LVDLCGIDGVKTIGCDSLCCELNVRQAMSQHGHTLPFFFAIDQSHRPPSSAEIQPMSQQAAAATPLIAD